MPQTSPDRGGAEGRVRAAQYLRMSTEHQRYSLENQAIAIAAYAAAHGYEIVQTFADAGLSGLTLKPRTGLRSLLADVVGGAAGFERILVYDISRWGRFQNPDQAAHYEFICVDAGVSIEYCAEPFENDGSPASSILKSLKRVMAAEYSRELSLKTAEAQHRYALQGFWQGGPPGYGFRRQIVDHEGQLGAVLERGQYKAIQGQHSILVPGPAPEIEIIRRIFHLFVDGRMPMTQIARRLNAEGRCSGPDGPWTRGRISALLTSRKCIGELEVNKSFGRLGARRRRFPKAAWVIAQRRMTPIVPRKLFDAAQRLIAARTVHHTNEAMIAALADLHAKHGRITTSLIQAARTLPSSATVISRFGGIEAARAACGHPSIHPPRKRVDLPSDEALRRLAALFARQGYLSRGLINAQSDMPCAERFAQRYGSMLKAYAMVGYTPLSPRDLASPVGRARDAARLRRQKALQVEADSPSLVADD